MAAIDVVGSLLTAILAAEQACGTETQRRRWLPLDAALAG